MVIHYVDSMDQAILFYQNALRLTVLTQSPGWSTLRINETLELALHTRGDAHTGCAEKHPFDTFETTLVLTVDDLATYCEQVTEYGGTLDRIIEPHPGVPVRMGLVRDPAGNGFQVNQYVG